MNQSTEKVVVAVDELTIDLEQSAPPPKAVIQKKPQTLRGGDDNDDNTEVRAPDEEESVKSEKAMVPEGGDYKLEEDTEAQKRKRQKKMLAACCCLLLLLALLLGLGFGLQGDETPTGSIVADTPTAGATGTPTTLAPTSAPVEGETPSPTAPPTFSPGTVSRLACDEILEVPEVTAGNGGNSNFKVETIDGREICADVYAGYDPERPNRNHWNAVTGRRNCQNFTYTDAVEKCDTVGARLCDANELAGLVGQGTGCGTDNRFIWSQSRCDDGGYYTINIEFREDQGETPFYYCETDTSFMSGLKCCGDADLEAAQSRYNEFYKIEA